MEDFDGDAMNVLLGDLREYLKGQQRKRLGKYRPQAEPESEPAPEKPAAVDDGAETMPEECRSGECDHPEHWDDGMDELLG